MPQKRENRAHFWPNGPNSLETAEERLRSGFEERSKDEASPTALAGTHACRAPPQHPTCRLACEALLGGSQGQGLDRLNSTKIVESSQIRAWPQKGKRKYGAPSRGPRTAASPTPPPPTGSFGCPHVGQGAT